MAKGWRLHNTRCKNSTHILRKAFFAALLFLFSACEKDITEQVQIDAQPKLVITSYISPQDTALVVRVSKTRPAVGKVVIDGDKVTDATVNISDGSKTIRLFYVAEQQLYRVAFSLLPIVPNKTYSLTVSTPNGDQVSAICSVPDTKGITFTKLEYSVRAENTSGDFAYNRHTLDFQWQDAPGRENYYHALSSREYLHPQLDQILKLPLDNYDQKIFFSDEWQDGQLFASQGRFVHPVQDSLSSPYYLKAHLSVTDRPYCLYHELIAKQNNAADNQSFC